MMVELQQGRIGLQSRKGVGTVIRFFITVERCMEVPEAASHPGTYILDSPYTISAARTSRAESPDSEGTDLSATRQPLNVLVVEDNLVNQKILIKLLKGLGCTVTACGDGEDCVALLQRPDSRVEHFDLCLMDLEMPRLDGLSASRRIRELESEGKASRPLPIVAVSGNARAEWTERAEAAGMNGFIRKPYSKAELQELLARYPTTLT
jgi:CheY-like chemotaxis protein